MYPYKHYHWTPQNVCFVLTTCTCLMRVSTVVWQLPPDKVEGSIAIYIYIYIFDILFSSVLFHILPVVYSFFHLSSSSLSGFSFSITLFLLFLLRTFAVFLVFPLLFCFSCILVLLQCHNLPNCESRGSNN